MNWLFLALVGHLANGVAFTIDKILLQSAFTRSATYAGIVGILSAFAIVLFPFVEQWPVGVDLVIALISGATFVLALWAFFGALARAEASRVVPIVGSLIPLLTLVGTYFFLGERLGRTTLIGFALLIVATIILSGGGKGKPTPQAIWLSLISAFLFAVASVTAKAIYDSSGFLGSFLVTRIVAVLTSLLILYFIDRRAGIEVLSMVRPARKTRTNAPKRKTWATLLMLTGQTLGALGFISVQWATSQGSAAIVNALQAIQYAFLVLVAFALKKRAPQLLGETLTPRVLVLKSIALACTAAGLALIV